MKTNENFDNKLEIFTIFIRGKASFWDFGNHHDKYLHHLDNIALKGGTGQAKYPDSFIGLNNELKKIANSFNHKYGLKIH